MAQNFATFMTTAKSSCGAPLGDTARRDYLGDFRTFVQFLRHHGYPIPQTQQALYLVTPIAPNKNAVLSHNLIIIVSKLLPVSARRRRSLVYVAYASFIIVPESNQLSPGVETVFR